jgi:hypothetical protein
MRLAGRIARLAGYKSRRAFLDDISPEEWAEHVAAYNVEPWGPHIEARQRADTIAAIYAAGGSVVDPEMYLDAWGYGDDSWDSMSDDEQDDHTVRTVRAVFGR